MSVLGIMVLGVVADEGMRSLLFVLLMLAIVFLVAGAILAVMALRNQRKVAPDVAALEQLENEAG